MLKFIWSAALLISAMAATAQHRTISGQVRDTDGHPFPGATITAPGNRPVTADNEGRFSLEADSSTHVSVTAVGALPTDVVIGAQDFIDIRLQRSNAGLDTVVVTALGIRRSRSSLPYATQQVSAAELNRTPVTNFTTALSGKVAGLQITAPNTLGGSANVILRGSKSLTQSNQALFVVDGVPFDNSTPNQNGYDLGNLAADLNPADIESVTVLKGAAASALYGSRAANGVIVVTTRKGSANHAGLGITVNEGIRVGSVDKSTLPRYQTEYGQGYGSAGYSSGYPNESGFFYYTPVNGSNGQPERVVQTDQDQVWGPAYDPSLNVYQWNAFSPGNPNYGKATPWVAAAHHDPTDLFRAPIANVTGVAIDGGDEKLLFRTSYTNSFEQGILPNSNIRKNVFQLSATYHLTDDLTAGGSIFYIDQSGLNRDSYDFRATNTIVRDFRQWWPTSVDLQQQKDDYFRTRTNNTWNWLGGYANSGSLPQPAYHNNAYWTLYENYNNDSRQRYFGNIHLDYRIADGLSLTARVARDNYDQLFESRVAVGSFQTASYKKFNGSFTETNYDLLLRFDRNVSEDFNLKALLGGNVRQNLATSTAAATNGGLVIPRLYALSNSVKTPDAPAETYAKKEVDGVFGGITLGFRKLATIDATVRRDQSSALPKGNNAYYYPAVSANLIFSQWLSQFAWLSFGKLRANYAEAGNDAPVYSLQNTYLPGTTFNGQPLFNYTSVNNNQNLKPERNRTYELGAELAFLNNRIAVDVTYYHSRLTDQITPITPSTATGFSSFYVNGGAVQNQGVELVLNATPVRLRDFSWNVAINWSRNSNKVISLYGGQSSYTIASFQNSVQLVAEVGKPYGILRGSDYQYLNGRRLIDADGYPVKSPNSKSDIGNINPDWLGGITNTFTYKQFALSFLIDVKQGGDLYSLDMDYGSWSGVYAETAGKNDLGNPLRNPLSSGGGIVLQGVTADGKPNTVRVDASDINVDGSRFPFSSINSLAAKSYVYDASYVKLRELSLSYSVPASLLKGAAFVKSLNLALTGRNLWIIHKNLPYADPEQGTASTTTSSSAPIVFNQNASIGYQNGAYPNVRQWAFNVQISF